MTNDQMERRLSAALDKTAPDDVDGVLSRCTERKGTVVPMKKKNNRMKKWMQTVAACLAVLLLGGGGLLVQQAHAVTSVVSLDVNPSIELRVNSREKVVSCQALNQEAQAVLEDMDGIMEKSRQVTRSDWEHRPLLHRVLGGLLRPFAMWM